jgi:uncharacterized protein (DUF58 family)
MRPTKAGLGLGMVTLISASVGRVFGSIEMFYLAGMCATALLLGLIYTATVRLDLAVARSASPVRLRTGSPARVDLQIDNKSRRRTPTMTVQDRVQKTQGAVLALAPISHKTPAKVAYRLPASRRGPIEIGPLSLTMGDPLGLTKTTVVASGSVELLVHPELFALKPLKAVAGHDPLAEQRRARSLANSGYEFFALRPYMVGDELRRVHWPASARSTGELVVRQDERPRTGRVTVVLDQQADHYDEDGFERAVSAALSALYAAWNGEDALRFSTSSNPNGVDLVTRAELAAVDARLAHVQLLDIKSLGVTLEAACRFHGGGTLVVVTGNLSTESHAALARARRAFGRVIVIASQRHTDLHKADWANVIFHDGENDFVDAWRRHLDALSVAR